MKTKDRVLMWSITRNGELRPMVYHDRASARLARDWAAGYSYADGAKYRVVRVEVKEVRCP